MKRNASNKKKTRKHTMKRNASNKKKQENIQ